MLAREMPGIKLLVSYADPEHGHIGGIYQAMNWVYVGESCGPGVIALNGKPTHRRTISSKYGTSNIEWLRENVDPFARVVTSEPKFKYLYALDHEMQQKILPMCWVSRVRSCFLIRIDSRSLRI
jgi:hypothetical protein